MLRETRREKLLLLSLDSSRLRQKELLQQMQQHRARATEMQEAAQYRMTGSLPPLPSRDPSLDQALGISTPQP